MSSFQALVVLALVSLSSRGERVAAIYREGAELVGEHRRVLGIEMDEMTAILEGVELPPEALDEMGESLLFSMHEEQSLRLRDVVLTTSDGQPRRVRRTFELLQKREREDGEEKESTGPLEGRVIVLSVDEDGTVAELADDGVGLDELYLANHHLTHHSDVLLPDGPVEVGDTWALSDEAQRRMMELGDGPVLFEEEEEEDTDLLTEFLRESGAISGEVEFVEIEERDGLRCAVLAFTIKFEIEFDDVSALGIEFEEEMEEPSGTVRIDLERRGKLWQALAEGRPVAMEDDFLGSMELQVVMIAPVEGHDLRLEIKASCSIEGEGRSTWTAPE